MPTTQVVPVLEEDAPVPNKALRITLWASLCFRHHVALLRGRDCNLQHHHDVFHFTQKLNKENDYVLTGKLRKCLSQMCANWMIVYWQENCGYVFFKGGISALININHTCKLQNCSLINQFTTVSLQLRVGEFNLAKITAVKSITQDTKNTAATGWNYNRRCLVRLWMYFLYRCWRSTIE
jgi:hypothetical protein